jgi:hypothetical protein
MPSPAKLPTSSAHNPMPSERKQFRVLYREFLFRLIDLELLPTPSDMVKLLGQLAALLAAFNLMFASGVRRILEINAPPEIQLASARGDIHFFIATTMVAVGLLAVLCWDSTFPDRRDVLVLAPLPVRTRTLFAAKLAALITALSLTVICVNIFTGLTYPLLLGGLHNGATGAFRWFAAYWLTAIAAGGFILTTILAIQGIASQFLPRRIYVKFTATLQLLTFVTILGVYFLQPPLATTQALTNPANAAILDRLPTYWFLGLFLSLSGTLDINPPIAATLASHARLAILISSIASITALALTYRRTMRKLVEEPDILPGQRLQLKLPQWRNGLTAALTNFSLRTLLRSRQHRLIYALYLGIGLAFALACARRLLYGEGRALIRDPRGPLLVASILLLCCAIVGMRVVMTMPINLKANWIFRITTTRTDKQYTKSIRTAFATLAILPTLLILAATLVVTWPLRPALIHITILAMWAWLLLEFSLKRFHKIPFTCSYLPGKANLHIRSGAGAMVLIGITDVFVQAEKRALTNWRTLAWLMAFLTATALFAKWRSHRATTTDGEKLTFEESPQRDLHPIQLYRDGKLALDEP